MKCVLLSILSILATVCYSQKFELKYEFPDSVNNAILRGVKIAKTDSVYIQFYGKEEDLNVISVRSYRLYDGDFLKTILNSSRCVEIAGKKVPIMFEEDMKYEMHFRHYTVYGNGYNILFTDDGKIKEEHRSQ